MIRRSRVLAAAAVAASLAVAGCGGDDDETTTTEGVSGATGATSAAAIPVDDWIEQADEICKEENAVIDEAAIEAFQGGEPGEAAISEFAGDVVVPGLQAQHDAISALPPPEGEEDRAAELVDALQSGIEEIEEDPSALGTETESPDSAFTEANALASELGLQECGEE